MAWTVLEDWEDGDTAGWGGSTGALSAGTDAINGSYSGRHYDDGGGTTTVYYDLGEANRIRWKARVDNDTGDSGDTVSFTLSEGSDNIYSIVTVEFEQGTQDVLVGGAKVGDWSTGVVHSLEVLLNGDGTFDFWLDGTKVLSDADHFNSAPAQWFNWDVGTSSSGQELSVWHDDMEKLSAPDAPTLSLDATRDTEADLSWTDEGADSYNVYRAQASGSTAGDYSLIAEPTGTTFTDTELENGERYYYRVSGENSIGEGDLSNEVAGTTGLPATTPSLDASVEGEIAVSWTKQDNSSDGEWELYRSQDGSFGSRIADGISPSTTSYTDANVEDGERYYYTLRRITNHTQEDGTQVAATTVLPDPTLDALDASTQREITVSYSLGDDSSDGDVLIERSTDGGSTWTEVATVTDLSATSYTDTGADQDGERYTYRLTRRTGHASAQSGTLAATTILPTPSAPAHPTVDAQSAEYAWDATHNTGATRVEYRPTDESAWQTHDTVDHATESATVDVLRNGEAYDSRVVAETEDAESPSNTSTFETTLPDEDQPQLGNGVEDEIQIDRVSAPTNYGHVRIQTRETGQSSWTSSATGWDEQVLDHDTLTTQVTGREDGEEYEVRARTETEHVDGEWTDPVAITTQFPGAQNLTLVGVGETSADLEWDDVSDNEDGTLVERREQFRHGWGVWREIDDLPPTSGDSSTVQYTDDQALPDTTYQYRVTPYTEHTEATAGPIEATTADDGVGDDRVPPEGWHVVVEDTLGNTYTPDVVGQPSGGSRLNDLPRVEIPVARSERWSDDAEWERAPLRVYRNGQRLPIEQIETTRQEPDRSVLVGVGGVALRERVAVDVIEEDAHLTAEGLIADTPYLAHVDDPAAETTPDLLQQQADTETEWDDRLASTPGAQDVYETTGTGRLQTRQTAYFVEAEDATWVNGSLALEQDSDRWSGNEVVSFEQSGVLTYHETTVTTDHEIPDGSVRVSIRTQQPTDGHPGFDINLDGTTIQTIPADAFATGETEPNWHSADASGALAPGEHTIELDFNAASSASDPVIQLDAVCLEDDRYDSGIDASSGTVIDGVLQDIHEYPSGIQAQTVDAVSVRQVVGGRLEATVNDTSGSQAVAMSNDSGATWIEAANSETVEGEFGDGSTSIRARFTLGGYDADPSTSPAGRTAPQSVDLYSLYADLNDTPLLANRSWDQTLLDILQSIADYGNFIFEVVWDSDAGSIAVEWTQAGQRTATVDPSLVDYSVSTDYSRIHRKAVIYGTGVPESSTITAQHDSWVALEHDWLQETGEVVESVADGTTYERSVDYELRPNAGEIEALSTGSIGDGEELRVSYDKRIRGTFESESYTGEYETFVDDVPAITTARNADAAALAIVQEASEPLVTASVTIDREPGVSLVEAIDLAELPVGEPLEVWSSDNEPGQVTMQLGSREQVDETISRIQSRLGAVAQKT